MLQPASENNKKRIRLQVPCWVFLASAILQLFFVSILFKDPFLGFLIAIPNLTSFDIEKFLTDFLLPLFVGVFIVKANSFIHEKAHAWIFKQVTVDVLPMAKASRYLISERFWFSMYCLVNQEFFDGSNIHILL